MLKEKLNSDLVQALKQRDDIKVSTLRLLLSAMHNREIEKKGKGAEPNLNDDEILDIVRREVKKRKEAIEFFVKGGRTESAEKEWAELKILESYLPQSLGDEEVKKIIDEIFNKVKPEGQKDFGKFMGEVMKQLKGRAEAGVVSHLVKEKLG